MNVRNTHDGVQPPGGDQDTHYRLDPEVPLWDIKALARFLAISVRKAEDIVSGGQIHCMWVGGQRRFHPKAVEAFLRNSMKKPRQSRRRAGA